ncbi:polysaccharide biosynthesis C-terminal domain-containing protein [Sphingomonas montana]|uniref:oligosaccharide flippase family protein n=1 Tax=Sphingomonas montana TaxID=1843236 RepID=UPI00096F9CFF|nr:polysaccharide biosynthesis C-terminal domain-containing protein [Sphingomonas montana]
MATEAPDDQPVIHAATTKDGKSARSGFGWDALSVALSRFFQKGTYFITSIILARLLGPEGRGLVSALLVPSQLAQNFSEMGIRQSTAYHLGRGIFPLERLLPTLLMLVPIATGFAAAATLLYLDYARVAEGDWTLRLLAIAAIPTSLTSSYASGVFLGRQRIAAFRKTSWRPALVRMLLIILLGWGIGMGVDGVMLANLGASCMGAGYALILLRKEGKLRLGFDREVATKLQRRGLSYAASLFMLMLNYKIMILLLTRFSTLSEVGIYAQATVVAELVWEIPTAVSALLLSRSVNAKEQKAFSVKVLVLARMSFLIAVVASIGIAIGSWLIFPIMFGRSFAGSAAICNALLPGVVAFIFFKVLNSDLAGRGKPWASMLVMSPVLVCNVLLGWWAITHYGAFGAAVASSATYVLATLLYTFLYAKMTGFSVIEMLRYRRTDFALFWSKLPFAPKLGKRRD